MARLTEYRCDYCGRRATFDARGLPVVDGWARVIPLEQADPGAGRDACAACLARMDGWKGGDSG